MGGLFFMSWTAVAGSTWRPLRMAENAGNPPVRYCSSNGTELPLGSAAIVREEKKWRPRL